MSDLKELTYAISYELDENGINKAISHETEIDNLFKAAATSASKIDSNIGKMASTAQKTSQDTKGIGTELDKAVLHSSELNTEFKTAAMSATKIDSSINKIASGAQKASNDSKGIGENFEKSQAPLDKLKSGLDGVTGKLSGVKNFLLGAAATIAGGAGLFNLVDKAASAGDSIYQLSQKLHVTASEATSMSKILKVTDTDTQPFISTITKLDKAIDTAGVKGNTTTKVLDAFHISLTDAQGKLLPIPTQLDKLAEGYKKAAAAGLEEEYSATVLGAKGQELIPLLQDYAEAKEIASKVKGIGIDPQEAHDTEVNLKVLKMQTSQLGLVFANALMPVAEKIVPELTDAFGELAQYVNTHKDEIDKSIDSLVNTGEGIEKTLTPIVKTAFNFISEHGSTVASTLIGVATAFETLSATASVVNGVMGILTLAGLGPLVLTILGVATAVGVAAGAFVYWKTHTEEVEAKLDNLWYGLKLGAESSINFMINEVNKFFEPFDLLIGAVDKITGLKIPQVEIANVDFTSSGRVQAHKMGGNSGYASGTPNATPGIHPVSENGMELILGPQLKMFNGGETVLNNTETTKIFNQSTATPGDKSNGGMKIGSQTFNFNINVGGGNNPKATAYEVERVLREKFSEYLNDEFKSLSIQLGYTPLPTG